MFRITHKAVLAEKIVEIVIDAPRIARKAEPGHFVLVRGEEGSERIPLTIADSDPEAGTVTLVIQVVGKTTTRLCEFEVGEGYTDVVGPLGTARSLPQGGETVVCVSGGLGVAPMFPQTKACHANGNKVISIIGARSESLLFWRDRVAAVSDVVHYSTDDGSFGHHGFATQILEDIIAKGEKVDHVIAIGPVPHMKAVAQVCKKHEVPITVSMNPVMVDGTGMCGGCRVLVDGKPKYACVDGPEFDGALVDFDDVMTRQQTYRDFENAKRAGGNGDGQGHDCRLDQMAERVRAQQADLDGKRTAEYYQRDTVAFLLNSISRLIHGEGWFDEVAPGLTAPKAKLEASRCSLCGEPSCIEGCPVEVDIPGFIGAVQAGDMPRAATILKDKNSLPAICGRVCPQETQCEAKCIVGKHDRPVAIGLLERYVADWEAANMDVKVEPTPRNGKRVAVVGSGPGGLTCAGDLAKMGYDVTIFEAFHDTGGVLRYGIPEFRLPKVIVDREVEYVKSLGVTIELNTVVGKTFSVHELLEDGFDAAFIAVGAGAPIFLGIPGENLVGVYSANEFLTRVNLMKAYRRDSETPVLIRDRVAVIGAGNVAMDAARTALRLGAKEVSIVYRRSDAEMPARAAEIHHAKKEGIKFELLTAPLEILGDEKQHVRGMRCQRMQLGEPDSSGRRRPVPIPDSEFEIPCELAIPALGNGANEVLTKSTDGLSLNKWGNIEVDPKTMLTSIPGVYAGGDIVTGSATVIEAMGAGRIAANAIHEYLGGKVPVA